VLWDVSTGRRRAVLPQVGPLPRLAFSPDGRRLAVATRPGWGNQPGFRLWDVNAGQPIGEFEETASDPLLHFGADGSTLETFDPQVGQLRRWDAATGRSHGPAVTFTPWQAPVHWAWSPSPGNWERLATGSVNGVAQQWDAATGRSIGPPIAHAFPVIGLE